MVPIILKKVLVDMEILINLAEQINLKIFLFAFSLHKLLVFALQKWAIHVD